MDRLGSIFFLSYEKGSKNLIPSVKYMKRPMGAGQPYESGPRTLYMFYT